MRKHLLAAAILYFADAWVMGQGIWSTLPAVVVIIVLSIRSRPLAISKMLVWVAVPIATIATLVLFGRISRHRAETVVRAVEAYHAAEGRYPDTLEEVTPKYLSRIPSATPRLSFDKFVYFPKDEPFLLWTVIPPFGRRTYDFKDKRWSSID